MIVPELLEKEVVLLDIGAVGNPPSRRLPLKDDIHLIGFEPNKEECRKLNESGCGYKKSEFLPYAIGERDEKRSFYITENHECCSLLKPNFNWLERFDYGSLFNINQKIEVETLSLDSIAKFRDVRVDALKIDAQGNELPILKGAESILNDVFYRNLSQVFTRTTKRKQPLINYAHILILKDLLAWKCSLNQPKNAKIRHVNGNLQKDNQWPAKVFG